MFLGGNRVFFIVKKTVKESILRGGSGLKIASGLDICSEKKASKYSHYNRVGIYPLLAAKLYRHRILFNLPDSSPP